MSFNFSNFTKDLKSFGDRVSSELNSEFIPFAQRSARIVQEKIGNVPQDDISQLPSEYLELAKKCNGVEALYKNILKITAIYDTESYDYPLNVQELFSELGQSISSRVALLSRATTPAEAQAALVNPQTGYKPPRTLYHALSRATDPQILDTPLLDPTHQALSRYSEDIGKIGNARLSQDQLVVSRFNKPLQITLRQLIAQSNAIQKKVDAKRVDYDLARRALANGTNPAKEPALRVAMEGAEDDFANAVEDAINVMQNVLDHAKPLEELLELVQAQLAYHKLAAELLGGLVKDLEGLSEGKSKKSDGDFDI